MLGIIVVFPFVFLAGLLIGMAFSYWWCTRHRPTWEPQEKVDTDQPEAPEDYVDDTQLSPAWITSDKLNKIENALHPLPRFGKPEVVLYRPQEWETPLRCNGECVLPEFYPGQAIWLVPINDGTGELPYCLDCVDAVIPVVSAEVDA